MEDAFAASCHSRVRLTPRGLSSSTRPSACEMTRISLRAGASRVSWGAVAQVGPAESRPPSFRTCRRGFPAAVTASIGPARRARGWFPPERRETTRAFSESFRNGIPERAGSEGERASQQGWSSLCRHASCGGVAQGPARVARASATGFRSRGSCSQGHCTERKLAADAALQAAQHDLSDKTAIGKEIQAICHAARLDVGEKTQQYEEARKNQEQAREALKTADSNNSAWDFVQFKFALGDQRTQVVLLQPGDDNHGGGPRVVGVRFTVKGDAQDVPPVDLTPDQ